MQEWNKWLNPTESHSNKELNPIPWDSIEPVFFTLLIRMHPSFNFNSI